MKRVIENTKGALLGVLKSALLASAVVSFGLAPALAQVPSFQSPPIQPSTFMSGFNFAPPAGGTGDLFCIIGSATRLTKVKSIRVSAVGSGSAVPIVNLVKRAALDTGGTLVGTIPVGVAIDSQQVVATPTATIKAWTAVPTLVGTPQPISSQYLLTQNSTTPLGASDRLEYSWTPSELYSDVRLRSAIESLCVNAPGVLTSITGMSVELVWTEQ